MVYYFKATGVSNEVDPPVVLYMGKHKEENEELIKHGLDTDVWFHVDKLSSAHVYLRLPEGWSWNDIPQEIVNDCAHLTKANSIQGNKDDNITVIYTPWSNLKKTGDMAPGQVGFHQDRLVKRVNIEKRVNAIINRLEKTKEERFPDLRAERLEYDRELKRTEADRLRLKKKEELAWAKERQRLAHNRDHAYDDLFTEDSMRHSENDNRDEDGEDDFM